jgi:hypothetical protein
MPAHVLRDTLEAQQERLARQPALGVTGLLLVVPVAVLLAFAADGAQGSTILLGPFAVFALAPIAMIAFWWENWPGTSLRPSWSGWVDTLLIAAIAVVMTLTGQLLVGHFDLRGIFSLNLAPSHSPVFPITLPLAGAAFVAIMQLTFVCERWPFHRLGSNRWRPGRSRLLLGDRPPTLLHPRQVSAAASLDSVSPQRLPGSREAGRALGHRRHVAGVLLHHIAFATGWHWLRPLGSINAPSCAPNP